MLTRGQQDVTRCALLAAIVADALASPIAAQAASSDPVGTWRGTSRCELRATACHDESVVYRIARTSARDSLAMDGRKLVNTAEVPMGILGCRLDAPSARLTCHIPNGIWLFTIRDDSLVGELRSADGTKIRDVRALRAH